MSVLTPYHSEISFRHQVIPAMNHSEVSDTNTFQELLQCLQYIGDSLNYCRCIFCSTGSCSPQMQMVTLSSSASTQNNRLLPFICLKVDNASIDAQRLSSSKKINDIKEFLKQYTLPEKGSSKIINLELFYNDDILFYAHLQAEIEEEFIHYLGRSLDIIY